MAAFDRKEWGTWANLLPERAARVPPGGPIFAHLALERWRHAHELHRQALRNRTRASYHRLRIGIKRFRYTVENFLPGLYESWEKDLKRMQDVLGEMHDLDVLCATARQISAFPDDASRAQWSARVEQERGIRLATYRSRMLGEDSLWGAWRAGLLPESELEAVAQERLVTWASLFDPDFSRTRDSARLALRLYDGLVDGGISGLRGDVSARRVLQLAALLRNVGRGKRARNYRKISCRMIRSLPPPLGLRVGELEMVALVVRYHGGALPEEKQDRIARLSNRRRRLLNLLAGILRLCEALDDSGLGRMRSLETARPGGIVVVRVRGTPREGRAWEKIAAARYLLEVACGRPVVVQADTPLKLEGRPLARRPRTASRAGH